MLHVACALWDANDYSEPFSRCYTEEWVEKLYRGFSRNLTRPFRFVCFSDRERAYIEPQIEQERLATKDPHYGCCIEPFRLNEPMIFVGLDTIIVRNIDHMADYCMSADRIALPRDPYRPERAINGVVLAPSGHRRVFDDWRGENDMAWMRQQRHGFIDDIWDGHVVSLKAHDVRRKGLQDARIVYMHGEPKQHMLGHLDWMQEHWR